MLHRIRWFVLAALLALVAFHAQAAALLDMAGQKIIVMTADEFVGLLKDRDAEIAKLKAERKADCGII